MKKIVTFLFLFFIFLKAYASPIKQIIFFGDSLTDNGNLYHAIYGILPKSPPYFKGRFSNGYTWAEQVGKYYYNKSYIDFQIYAWGGATTIFHLPAAKFIAPTLFEVEVDKYLTNSLFTDKSHTLFSIWIGANDYLFYPNEETNALTQKIVDKIISIMARLNAYGATRFLILNLPDLSKTPRVQQQGVNIEKMRALSMVHNLKLEQAIKEFQGLHPDVQISYVDIYSIFNDAVVHPEKFNQKYHINITNTTEACWKGGVFDQNTLSVQSLNEEIKQTLLARKENGLNHVDTQAISEFIMETPSLSDSYALGKAFTLGNIPCANANEYLFWDAVHPSAVVHDVLAKIVVESLGELGDVS